MEIKVLKELNNDFFKRKDLEIEIAHLGQPTPKTDDLKLELAKKYSVDESQVLVDYILTTRGVGKSRAKVKVLKEKPVVVKKKEEQKKSKKEEKPAEKPKEPETKQNVGKSGKDETQTSETQ
jgi:ribosomal protein S24E